MSSRLTSPGHKIELLLCICCFYLSRCSTDLYKYVNAACTEMIQEILCLRMWTDLQVLMGVHYCWYAVQLRHMWNYGKGCVENECTCLQPAKKCIMSQMPLPKIVLKAGIWKSSLSNVLFPYSASFSGVNGKLHFGSESFHLGTKVEFKVLSFKWRSVVYPLQHPTPNTSRN